MTQKLYTLIDVYRLQRDLLITEVSTRTLRILAKTKKPTTFQAQIYSVHTADFIDTDAVRAMEQLPGLQNRMCLHSWPMFETTNTSRATLYDTECYQL